MRSFLKSICAAVLGLAAFVGTCAAGNTHRVLIQSSLANSQFNTNFLGGAESITTNLMKLAGVWAYGGGPLSLFPLVSTDLDFDGNPAVGGAWVGNRALTTISGVPNQFENPDTFTYTAAGQGSVNVFGGGGGWAATTCTGTPTGNLCNNSACGTITGSISGQTLTVTVAASCSLLVGEPITNASTVVDPFGVPTVIVGMSGSANCPACTGSGGTGTYLINFPQNIASGTLVPGMFVTVNSTTAGTPAGQGLEVIVNSIVTANPLKNMGLYRTADAATYASGQLVNPLFKQRVQQGNFLIMRDLDTANTNVSAVTTWASRKRATYFSYVASEMRASVYAGVATYALNGSSNDYSVNLGSALPVHLQTVCITAPVGGTSTNSTATFSIDGGVTKTTVFDYRAQALATGSIAASRPYGFVFDATLQVWLQGGQGCMNNFMPPEAFARMASEIGVGMWIVEPMYASDPITDYMPQYYSFLKSTYPTLPRIWEVPDETWNCSGGGVGSFPSAKSHVYIGADATWSTNSGSKTFCTNAIGTPGDIQNWTGKVGSLLAQSLRSLGSADPIVVGSQTVGNAGTAWKATVLAPSYAGQNPSNIPTQSGCAGFVNPTNVGCLSPFLLQAAYTAGVNGITINNYWQLSSEWGQNAGIQGEVASGYCYFFQTGGCASQSSVMTSYFNSWQCITQACGSVSAVTTTYGLWFTFAQTCAGGAGCTPMKIYNYEGTYSAGLISADVTASITGATNAANAVLTINPNGCVAGQTVGFTNMVGGTWSTLNTTTATVVSATSGTCTVSASGVGLGALTSGTLTYTGSANYVNYIRNQSWLAPDLATWTTTLYQQIAGANGACGVTPCSLYPSQFVLAEPRAALNWFSWTFDLYGYALLATCSSCTVSGANMTLGGTVTGIFTSGLTVMGSGLGGATITGACSQTGSGPAGSNAGDVCPLSASATVSSGVSMNGYSPPQPNAAGNSTTSPVKQWGAICKWNGNTQQCDGI